MLDLKPLELSDKQWIDPIVFSENSLSADYNFGNMFLWDNSYHQLVTRLEDRLIIKPTYDDTHFFAFPIGKGALVPAIEAMREDCEKNGIPFKLCGVAKDHLALLDEAFPGCFAYATNRNLYDYIYPAEKLATLSGKKLHGKRNHIHRFEEQNDWRYEKLSRVHFDECRALLEDWTARNADEMDEGGYEEQVAITRAFENYEALKLEGGVLFSGGKVIGFTIGEKICENGFDVHFEKAESQIQGAYPMICREFVRQVIADHPETQWINREDDMGKENLRQAKQSFYPEFLVEKYSATWKEHMHG